MSGVRGLQLKGERYQDLEVWRVAYNLALRVYQVTTLFPTEERFGLAQQLRRASVGVFTNLAEGHARGSRKEFVQFCTIARGSQAEVHSLLLFSKELGFLKEEIWDELSDGYTRVGQMLNKLVTSLRKPAK